MEQFEFEKWWTENVSNKRFANGNEVLTYIKPAITGFNSDIKITIIDELFRRNYVDFACEFIPIYGNDRQKQLIRVELGKWIDNEINDSNGSVYINVILKTYKKSDYYLINNYFSEQRTIWFIIPGDLFHVERNIFLSAFDKYLLKFKDDNFFKNGTFGGLVYYPDAIEFLINNLNKNQSNIIKKFCISKFSVPYYNEEIKSNLLRLSNK